VNFSEFLKDVNGHLDTTTASLYAEYIRNDDYAMWAQLPPGVTKEYARGKLAQRLITNPALANEQIESLKKFADDPAVQNHAVIKNGSFTSEPAVDYMKAREMRVANYNSKYNTNVQ
jgi:hypothetical protein